MADIKIRLASIQEIDWINKKYDEIGFLHPEFGHEKIAIAEMENQKVGLGRMVSLDKKNLELAGIYVFEPFRKRGVGKKIIEFLMDFREENQNVYCIPFSKLTGFYECFGFAICKPNKQIPKAILDKCKWCEKSHQALVEVLVLHGND